MTPDGHQLQRRLAALDDQRVAGVVAALEAHHALRVVGQPVDDLALAFVAPLGADDDDVAAGVATCCCCMLFDVSSLAVWSTSRRQSGAQHPAAVDGDQLAVAVELLALVFVARAGCTTTVSPASRRRRTAARSAGVLAPRRADRGNAAGAGAASAASAFRSRLKPTAGRLRPNTAPTSS